MSKSCGEQIFIVGFSVFASLALTIGRHPLLCPLPISAQVKRARCSSCVSPDNFAETDKQRNGLCRTLKRITFQVWRAAFNNEGL